MSWLGGEAWISLGIRCMWRPPACCHVNPAKSKGFSDSGLIEACVFLFG